jgi:predicted MFS family arabinose efflux permease
VDETRSSWRTTLGVSSALTTAVLPVFLVGALSGPIRRDLGFDEAGIGAAVTVLFAASSLAAAPAGRVAERVGAATALRLGVVIAGLATATMGALAQTWWQLAAPLVVVGAAVGLVDTGGARAFADAVPRSSQGSAFGVKEASIPAASLLAGLALPTVGVQLGWRTTFVAGLAVAAVVLAALPGRAALAPARPPAPSPGRPPGTPAVAPASPPAASASAAGTSAAATAAAATAVASPSLVAFAVGAGLGTGAATAAATFLVPAGIARGLGPSTAGIVLSVASVASIAVRVLAGRWADDEDRLPGRAVGMLLAVGTLGALALVPRSGAVATALAGVLVLGGGWGWTGLAFLTAVRARPTAPAAAAGVVLTGLGAGGALGPLAFGALASRVSYAAAWTAAAAALGVAAAVTLRVHARLRPPPEQDL